MSLLSQAKAIKISRAGRKPRKISKQECELAMAWLKGEIRPVQLRKLLQCGGGSAVYHKISMWLQESYSQGKIKIKEL